MKYFKRHEVNYALILPVFLLFLLSIAVQYGASVLDGIDPGPVVVRQLFFCIIARNRIVCGQFTFDDFFIAVLWHLLCSFSRIDDIIVLVL